MKAYLSNTAALSLLYAHVSRAMDLIARNKINDALVVLQAGKDAVAEPMKAIADVEADFAEMMGAMPVCAGPNPISQFDEE